LFTTVNTFLANHFIWVILGNSFCIWGFLHEHNIIEYRIKSSMMTYTFFAFID